MPDSTERRWELENVELVNLTQVVQATSGPLLARGESVSVVPEGSEAQRIVEFLRAGAAKPAAVISTAVLHVALREIADVIEEKFGGGQ